MHFYTTAFSGIDYYRFYVICLASGDMTRLTVLQSVFLGIYGIVSALYVLACTES